MELGLGRRSVNLGMRPFFCLSEKKPLHTGVRTGCHYLFSPSVCVCQCVCNIRRFNWLRELYEADCHNPGIYGSRRVCATAWNVFRRAPSRVGRCRGCEFRGVFSVGRFFSPCFP